MRGGGAEGGFAMNLEGSTVVRGPKDRVFAFFLEPAALSTCVDDPHTVEIVDADHFQGTIRTGVGAIKGTFAWSAEIAERAPPERARVQVRGSGMGSGFDIDATVEFQEAAGATRIRWRAVVTMGGPIATLGARLLQGMIDRKTAAFFEAVRKHLESQ